MNYLPHHRRALYGRTFDRPWRAADSDPISHYRAPHKFAGVALAVSIGVVIALTLIAWWSA